MNSALRIQIVADARQALAQLNQLRGQLSAIQKVVNSFSATSRNLATATNQLTTSQAKAAEAASKVAVAEAKAAAAQSKAAEAAAKAEVANNNAAISAERLAAAQSASEVAAAKVAAAQAQAAVAAERLAQAQNQTGASAERFAAAQSAAEAAAARVVAAENQAAASAERLTTAQNQAAASEERLAAAKKAAEAATSRASAAANAAAASAERVTAAQNAAATSAERLAQAKNQTAASASRASAAENMEAASEERLAAASDRAAIAALRLTAAQAAASNGTRNAAQRFVDFSAHMVKSGKDTQWLGRILTQNFTLPLALLTGLGAKWALSFETEVTQVRKVYGDLSISQEQATHDVALLSKAFIALSNIFGVHADEVAHIGAIWAQAGAKGTQLVKVTRATIEAMLLGDLDAETAAKGLLTVMEAYQISSDDLRKTLAVLNIVENETAVSFGDLLVVMEDSAGVARNAGVSIRELAALTASLVPIAGNASEAGNSLKTIIARVMAPTKEAASAMKLLGVDIHSASYASSTFTERLFQMADGWSNLDQNRKLAVARDVFGLRQGNRGITILDDLLNKQGRYAKALAVSADESRNLAVYQQELQTLLSSQPQAFKIATNRLRNFLTQAVIPLLPAINSLLSGLVALTQWFSHLNPHIQQAVLIMLGLLAIAGPLTQAFGLMKIITFGLGEVVGKLAVRLFEAGLSGSLTYIALGGLLVVAGGLGYALGGLEGALWGVAGALVVIAVTVGGVPAAIVAAVAVIAAAAYTIHKHWDALVPFFSKLVQNIVRIVAKGVSYLPQSFQTALQGVINILAKAGQIIYKLLSWLNPFARHSPSLVEQVLDGTAVIAQAYDQVATSVSNSMRRVTASVRQLGAEIANAKAAAQAQDLADAIKNGGAAGASPSTITSLVSDIANMKAGAEALSADIKAQTDTVANWKDQLDAANKTLDLANDKLKDLKQVVSDLDDQIAASKTRLQNWLDTPITGTYAFEDALFANDQAQKALQLQMAQLEAQFLAAGTTVDAVRQQMEDEAKAAQDAANANNAVGDSLANSGLTAEQATERMARLRAEIETLRGEQLDLRLQGAGSDVLAGIQTQIDQSEAARRDLAQIAASGAGSSSGGSTTPVPQNLKDLVGQYDDLQKQLSKLQNQGQILDLEKALALEPAQKALKDTQRVAEQSFDTILNGIRTEMALQQDLTARREEAVKAVEAQQVAVDALTASRDALQATYDAENDKLQRLQESYQSLTDAIKTAQDALDEATKLGEDILKKKDAAGAAGATPGDFAVPSGGGAGLGNEPLGNLQDLIDQLQAEAEKAFSNPFKGLKDKVEGWLAPVKENLSRFREWFKGFFGGMASDVTGFGSSLFNSGFAQALKTGWDAAWNFLKEDIWGPIEANVMPAVRRFIANMKEQFGPFVESLKNLWDSLGQWLALMWERYGPIIKFAFGTVIQPLIEFLKGFIDDAKIKWETFTRIVGNAIDAVSLIIGGLIQIITGIINIISGLMTANWSQVWEGAKQIVRGFIDVLGGIVGGGATMIFNAFVGTFTGLWNTVVTLWNSLGLPSFSNMWNWIQTNFINKVMGMGMTIADGFRSAVDTIGGVFGGLRGKIAGGINGAIGVLNGFIGGINRVASALGIGFQVGYVGYIGAGNPGEGPIGNNAMPFATGGTLPASVVGSGFVTNGARAIVGEGNPAFPEFVIPTDPQYRGRALGLMLQLAKQLKLGMASGGVIPQLASGGLLGGLVGGIGNTADSIATKIWDGAVSTARSGMSRVGGVGGALGRGALERLIVNVGNNVINKWLVSWVKQRAASIMSIFGVGSSGRSSGFGASVGALEAGGVVPHTYMFGSGAYVRGGFGGVTGKVGETRKDEIVAPVDKFLKSVNGGARTVIINGDLSFPNVTSGDDVKTFLDNLEALAS